MNRSSFLILFVPYIIICFLFVNIETRNVPIFGENNFHYVKKRKKQKFVFLKNASIVKKNYVRYQKSPQSFKIFLEKIKNINTLIGGHVTISCGVFKNCDGVILDYRTNEKNEYEFLIVVMKKESVKYPLDILKKFGKSYWINIKNVEIIKLKHSPFHTYENFYQTKKDLLQKKQQQQQQLEVEMEPKLEQKWGQNFGQNENNINENNINENEFPDEFSDNIFQKESKEDTVADWSDELLNMELGKEDVNETNIVHTLDDELIYSNPEKIENRNVDIDTNVDIDSNVDIDTNVDIDSNVDIDTNVDIHVHGDGNENENENENENKDEDTDGIREKEKEEMKKKEKEKDQSKDENEKEEKEKEPIEQSNWDFLLLKEKYFKSENREEIKYSQISEKAKEEEKKLFCYTIIKEIENTYIYEKLLKLYETYRHLANMVVCFTLLKQFVKICNFENDTDVENKGNTKLEKILKNNNFKNIIKDIIFFLEKKKIYRTIDKTWLLWSLVKLKIHKEENFKESFELIVSHLIEYINYDVLKKLNTSSLCALLWSFSKCHNSKIPLDIYRKLLFFINKYLDILNCQRISNIYYSLSLIKWNDDSFFNAIDNEVEKNINRFSIQGLINILWSMTKLKRKNHIFTLIKDKLLFYSSNLDMRNISLFLWCLSKNNYHNVEVKFKKGIFQNLQIKQALQLLLFFINNKKKYVAHLKYVLNYLVQQIQFDRLMNQEFCFFVYSLSKLNLMKKYFSLIKKKILQLDKKTVNLADINMLLISLNSSNIPDKTVIQYLFDLIKEIFHQRILTESSIKESFNQNNILPLEEWDVKNLVRIKKNLAEMKVIDFDILLKYAFYFSVNMNYIHSNELTDYLFYTLSIYPLESFEPSEIFQTNGVLQTRDGFQQTHTHTYVKEIKQAVAVAVAGTGTGQTISSHLIKNENIDTNCSKEYKECKEQVEEIAEEQSPFNYSHSYSLNVLSKEKKEKEKEEMRKTFENKYKEYITNIILFLHKKLEEFEPSCFIKWVEEENDKQNKNYFHEETNKQQLFKFRYEQNKLADLEKLNEILFEKEQKEKRKSSKEFVLCDEYPSLIKGEDVKGEDIKREDEVNEKEEMKEKFTRTELLNEKVISNTKNVIYFQTLNSLIHVFFSFASLNLFVDKRKKDVYFDMLYTVVDKLKLQITAYQWLLIADIIKIVNIDSEKWKHLLRNVNTYVKTDEVENKQDEVDIIHVDV